MLTYDISCKKCVELCVMSMLSVLCVRYTLAVDTWSLGALMLKMASNKYLATGSDEFHMELISAEDFSIVSRRLLKLTLGRSNKLCKHH